MTESPSGVRRPRRRTRTIVVAGISIVVVSAVAAAAYGFGGGEAQTPVANRLPPATQKVTRATLTDTENVSGTLGYGDEVAISARSSGSGSSGAAAGGGAAGGGTVTWVPAVGTVIARGQPVYKVDDRPVVLLYGALPLYRTLRPGVIGADVKQLEQNLAALGYTGFTVDDEYTGSTASAVRTWQEALGLDETGNIETDLAVVTPAEIRVSAVAATVGVSASGEILRYTGTTRQVSIALDVAKQHLVRKGIAATITLPDGKTVAGTVAGIGTVATRATSGQGAQQSGTTTIPVVVAVADQTALGTLDEAPVDVTLVASQRQNVLTVPVAALVALAEGGYGVQVVEGSTTRYVAVQTGMFAGGRVEVSGPGISEGMTVGVPK